MLKPGLTGSFVAVLALAFNVAAPVAAQNAALPAAAAQPTAQASPALVAAVDALPRLFGGTLLPERYFSAAFVAAVPPAQIAQLISALTEQHGELQTAALASVASSESGVATLRFARATATVSVAVDTEGRVNFMRIDRIEVTGDSFQALATAIDALPGTTGWGIYRLNAGAAPALLAGAGNGAPNAIGSSFKLVILAALDEEIAAGRMAWADVIPIDRRSVPSGMMQDWPVGAPVTLHSAASLMISISDNTATDLLLRHIGRERVEATARRLGGLSGPNAFPLLSTIEGTVLKNTTIGDARTRWLAGDEAARRRVLADFAALFTPENVSYGAFAGRTADIDRIEWFASADSIAALLGWFRHSASDTARAIMAINPGIAGTQGRWQYVGYKGGSEPGVMALNLLLTRADGRSYAIAMAWNDAEGRTEEASLTALVMRAVTLLEAGEPGTP